LIDEISKCTIATTPQNKLFDHKAVTLTFNESESGTYSRPTISNKELNDDLLEFLIKSTVCETYVLNCNGNVIGGVNKNFLLNTCGIIKRLIRDCGPPIELRAGQDPDPDSYAQREWIRNRIQVLTNTLNLNVLERIDLQCEPDIFMETLLNNLKNDVISHQIFMRKVKRMKIKQLTDTLLMLKKIIPVMRYVLRKSKMSYICYWI
jgi:hypothetical protein